jgi:hypothetical protein
MSNVARSRSLGLEGVGDPNQEANMFDILLNLCEIPQNAFIKSKHENNQNVSSLSQLLFHVPNEKVLFRRSVVSHHLLVLVLGIVVDVVTHDEKAPAAGQHPNRVRD